MERGKRAKEYVDKIQKEHGKKAAFKIQMEDGNVHIAIVVFSDESILRVQEYGDNSHEDIAAGNVDGIEYMDSSSLVSLVNYLRGIADSNCAEIGEKIIETKKIMQELGL